MYVQFLYFCRNLNAPSLNCVSTRGHSKVVEDNCLVTLTQNFCMNSSLLVIFMWTNTYDNENRSSLSNGMAT